MARKKIDVVAEALRGAEILGYFNTAPIDIAVEIWGQAQGVINKRKALAGKEPRKKKSEAPKVE